MFGVLFGWRKASKCKKVIKEAKCRLKLLKIKRHSIVKHLREDTANLIKIGHGDIALNRVEQLIKDESIAVAYELIDNFCDFIMTHFSYIRRHRDCRDDINESVSSLIYASARCGDLPELRTIRELFEDRYGHKLAMSAVELLPGNLVNHQIKEALNMKFVSEDMKIRMVNEIATDYCLQIPLLALEYYPEWKEEDKESNVQVTEIAKSSSSSSESLPGFTEETTLVYLDDVEEFPSPSKDEEGYSQEGTIFKFKSPMISKRASFRESFEIRRDEEDSTPKSCTSRISLKLSRKRSRRKSLCLENEGFKSYYDHPRKHRSSSSSSSSSHSHQSNSKRLDVEFSLPKEKISSSHEEPAISFLRAESMPLERPKRFATKEEFQRSNSCPVQGHPVHVHPKLPDCDELTATFLALKKDFLLSCNDKLNPRFCQC